MPLLGLAEMIEQRRTRILIVTRNLPPLVGGMERLNWHMASELSKVAEVCIVGPDGAAAHAPQGVDVIEVPLTPLWKFLLAGATQSRRVAKRWRPDIILAGSGLTAPAVWWAARCCQARSAAYVHGLDIAVKHQMYRSLWLPAIRRMGVLLANSRPTAALCRSIGVVPARITIVHPGVDVPKTENTRDQREAFRESHRLGARPVLLSVGRLSTRKGLKEFIENALPCIVARHPEVIMLVLGDAPNQALHALAQTREHIQSAAEAAGVGSNLRFFGKVSDVDLAAAYCAADVHVFPVRDIPGDPEGFGMVALEAAAYGVPTVAFGVGGVVDAVSDRESGRVITPGDYVAFADAVSEALSNGVALRSKSKVFAQRFAWPAFGASVSAALGVESTDARNKP